MLTLYKCPGCNKTRRVRVFPLFCSCGHVAEDGGDAPQVEGISPPIRPSRPIRLSRHKGAGDHLKEILAKYNAKPQEGCGCEDMVRKMNEWGVEGCRENRQTIIDKLQENAKMLGWWDTVAIGAALMQERWFNPLDRFGSLVDEAIRRAEKTQLAVSRTAQSLA